jgi:3-dehydroquinate dehydratase type I
LAGARPKICAAIVDGDLTAIKEVEPLVDLFEVRIDLIGSGWREVAGRLKKPWIACNRRAEEGGKWRGSESDRIKELLAALDLGASIIDVELATPGIEKVVKEIKGRAECILSYHNIKETPPLKNMKKILESEIRAGADICKVVTTARSFADNLDVLQLITEFTKTKIVGFAMGSVGQISRVLCPMAGGYFTYASITEGRESAEGQITVNELRKIYGMLKK